MLQDDTLEDFCRELNVLGEGTVRAMLVEGAWGPPGHDTVLVVNLWLEECSFAREQRLFERRLARADEALTRSAEAMEVSGHAHALAADARRMAGRAALFADFSLVLAVATCAFVVWKMGGL